MDDLATEMFGPVDAAPMEAAPVEAPVSPEPEISPVEAQPVAAPEPAPEPQRDEHGRYAPVAALVDERVKRQEAERRANELERQLNERSQQQARALPDPLDDPEGFANFQDQRLQQALTQQKFEMSDVMARQAHGAETVDAASEWAMEKAKSDPTFAAQYMRVAHPIDWIVQQHKRDADLSDYSKDPVAFARRILEQAGQPIAPVAAAPVAVPVAPAPAVAAPPRSIASQPAAGAEPQSAPIGATAAVESLFSK